jgi:nicotinic acid mononucleotide adenylyltransferase
LSAECSENLDYYFNSTNAILIKTAPLLDISAGIVRAKACKTIHIALDNEVKKYYGSYIPITMEKLPLKRLTS